MICLHPDCERETVSRHAKYCEKHRGGREMIDYSKCTATSYLNLDLMFSSDEKKYFGELCQQHRLAARPPGEQESLVNLLILGIMVRREAEKVKRNEGDISRLNAIMKEHHSLSKSLGLLPGKGGERAPDTFGVGEFLKGDGR